MSKRFMTALAACLIACSLCACTGMRGNVSDDPNGKVNNYGNGSYDTGSGSGSTGSDAGSSHDSTTGTNHPGGTTNDAGSSQGTTHNNAGSDATERSRSGENALNDLRRAAKDAGSAVKRALQ